MFYKFLGYMVWTGGKLYLRNRNGATYVPKSAVVGAAVVAGGLALAIVALKRNGSDG